jgi:hypothetical protein
MDYAEQFLDVADRAAIYYRSKCEADPEHYGYYGFLADEFDQGGFPQLVNYDEAGEVEGFAYDRTTAFLVRLLADARRRLAALEAQVQTGATTDPPETLIDLIEPGEAHGDAQTRLFALYNELTNKIVMGLASDAERRLHTRLHGGLHWISRGAVEVPTT